MKFDVAIIGGGPAGYTAAEKAGAAGLSVVLFEKNTLGGVCLNEGCIPTKTLLYSAKVFDTVKGAHKYAIGAENANFDLAKIIARKNKVVKKLVAGIRMKMTTNGVTIINGEASITGRDSLGNLNIACNGEIFESPNLILCTGSETFIPKIPGLISDNYWTSREALQAKELPKSLAIIGGGVVGMEFASFFNSLGSEVHVIEMLDEILPGMDRELSAMLRNEYSKRGICFYTQHKVISIDNDIITIEKDAETSTIQAEKILLSAGRRPITQNLGLETISLEQRGGVKTDNRMQTSETGVYACGDITGFSMLAHTAVREAEIAVENIIKKEFAPAMSYKAVPGVVYTNPEIASVGATEEQLLAAGRGYITKKIPMSYSGRFVAENELSQGVCKILLDDAETILGVHLLGNPASELVTIAAIAVERGMKASELASYIFPHPTVGEIIKETLVSAH
jgi:dihydrolipoamide dehydrogenase